MLALPAWGRGNPGERGEGGGTARGTAVPAGLNADLGSGAAAVPGKGMNGAGGKGGCNY